MKEECKERANKLFISHSSKDAEYVKTVVELLEDIGLSEEEMVCSSVPGYGIDYGVDIYDWLREQFLHYNLHVLFILSQNYYKSAPCLNEMGASWLARNKSDFILLPGFDYSDIAGAINPNQKGMKLDGDMEELKHSLGQLKDLLVEEFQLKVPSQTKWERVRDSFLSKIASVPVPEEEPVAEEPKAKNSLSIDAGVLLVYAANSRSGDIMMLRYLAGLSVQAHKWNFVNDNSPREEARWTGAVEELETYGLIEAASYKREVFRVTKLGFEIADEVKEKLQMDVSESPDVYLKN